MLIFQSNAPVSQLAGHPTFETFSALKIVCNILLASSMGNAAMAENVCPRLDDVAIGVRITYSDGAKEVFKSGLNSGEVYLGFEGMEGGETLSHGLYFIGPSGSVSTRYKGPKPISSSANDLEQPPGSGSWTRLINGPSDSYISINWVDEQARHIGDCVFHVLAGRMEFTTTDMSGRIEDTLLWNVSYVPTLGISFLEGWHTPTKGAVSRVVTSVERLDD